MAGGFDPYGIHPNQDFSSLVSEVRSPFFGADRGRILNLFQAELGAGIITTHHPETDPPEGYLLFEQFTQVKDIYIVLSGGIVFFADETQTERGVGYPMTIELLQHTKYFGTMGPGQVAGIVELLAHHYLDPKRQEADVRYRHILGSPLVATNDCWLLSGFAAPGSQILVVPAEKIGLLLERPELFNGLFPANDFSDDEFEKRVLEELLFRQAQYLYSCVLVSRGQRTALLALEFYDYYRRYETEIVERYKNKHFMSKVKVSQLSWLIGCRGLGAGVHVNELISAGVLKRYPPPRGGKSKGEGLAQGSHSRAATFIFDPAAMKNYYLLARTFRNEDITKELLLLFPDGFKLHPLAMNEG